VSDEFTFTMRYRSGTPAGESPNEGRYNVDTEAKALKSAINSTLAYSNIGATDIFRDGRLWARVVAGGGDEVRIEFESTEWVV